MFCVSPVIKRTAPGWVDARVWGVALAIALGSSLLAPPSLAQSAAEDEPSSGGAAYPTVSGGRIVRPTIQLGSQGESVRELQSMLLLLGYYPGPVTGIYEEETATATRRFQTAAGITADGIVGPATWSRLFPTPPGEANPPTGTAPATGGNSQPTTPPTNSASATPSTTALPVLRPGMEGDVVKQLQQRLRSEGFYSGAIDGIFGSETEAAVRQAQSANDLTVDGIVGPATWGVLN
ncbi:peptidoglycan-binding protein [Nodosilinea sp. LEGE 07088]|uniref:peptidoglycan-binding domain-containing protein n=1 Tax=Nodosilinea sp. LEGE 07088 TaxID=2777968 RepID=UPI00187FBA52|nr:peptidoglycan-binding protein [Nodosilinea sp. LEGE 07088]MBE9140612.1 peptidoglycan-binding protein [Nodosilinea sp. LEGE 07088]